MITQDSERSSDLPVCSVCYENAFLASSFFVVLTMYPGKFIAIYSSDTIKKDPVTMTRSFLPYLHPIYKPRIDHSLVPTLPRSTSIHGTIIFFGNWIPSHNRFIHKTALSALSFRNTSTDDRGGLENSEKLVLLKVIIPISSGICLPHSCSAFAMSGATASLVLKVYCFYLYLTMTYYCKTAVLLRTVLIHDIWTFYAVRSVLLPQGSVSPRSPTPAALHP
jgi:hypothetical protein